MRYILPLILLKENELDLSFINRIMFSDGPYVYISGCVNRLNVRIWSSETAYALMEHQRYFPKVNVWYSPYRDCVLDPSIFDEKLLIDLYTLMLFFV